MELARKAAAKVPAERITRRPASSASADRPGSFPSRDEARDRAVAEQLEADDPTPDLSLGGIVVDVDALLLAGLIVADEIASRSVDADRSDRMVNVISRRYRELIARVGEFNPDAVLDHMAADWDASTRLVALIEVVSSDPFSPFELRHSKTHLRHGFERVASLMGASPDELVEVQQTLKDAQAAHVNRSLARVGIWGLGGAVVVGAAGFAAAPVLGAALGSAAGLSGAAATSFGLSTLGGGSIAAGGLGMTGGLWMVAGTAAATGMVGSGGGALLYSLGGRQLRAEVVKLQATYKLVLLRTQADRAVAHDVVRRLHADAELLRDQVSEERLLNDANAHRIKELEGKIVAIEEALEWMGDAEVASA